MSNGFEICASTGAGVEGQQFSEYVFRRKRRESLPVPLPAPASYGCLQADSAGCFGAAGDDFVGPPVVKRERLSD
jgi:hypothetical protein